MHGHGGELVKQALANEPVNWVLQAEQLGTGHAVAQAMPAIPDDHQVLILFGDVPLVRTATLRATRRTQPDRARSACSQWCSTIPTGYGRIVRDNAGNVVRIVEEKDANTKERAIREINTGLDDRAGRRAAQLAGRAEERQRAGRVLSDRRRS